MNESSIQADVTQVDPAPDSGVEPRREGTLAGASATYSCDDNKLRLDAPERLDEATYKRVAGAGFTRAYKQKLWVAGMWTPEREDLLTELCGEIDDEDTSLIERAEVRADRFDRYQENRARDAETAHRAVASIADNIPLGQPILVGHHSERRARKDAERIRSGMKRAVTMWETSKYWGSRAAGAIRHAKYKELPAVRYRRIKGLEADKRKHEKAIAEADKFVRAWDKVCELPEELRKLGALKVANYDHVRLPPEPGATYGETLYSAIEKDLLTPEQAADRADDVHASRIAWARRWIAHIDNRLGYERAMLGEAGGLKVEKFDLQVGGRVLVRGEWCVILRLNRVAGAIVSVTTTARYVPVVGVEKIQDYRAPEAGDAEFVKAKQKAALPPIVNFPSPGCLEWTKADWDKRKGSGMATMRVVKATETHGAFRQREGMPPGGTWKYGPIFLTDQKRVEAPKPSAGEPEPTGFGTLVDVPTLKARAAASERRTAARAAKAEADAPYDALKQSLKAGVSVAVADQLFATPKPLAKRLVEMAWVQAGHLVLEPSAGTGALVWELLEHKAIVTAVEVNAQLAAKLPLDRKLCRDFLTLTGDDLQPFDRIVMNPPFAGGADIQHVSHAFTFLAPGGVLVAVMSAGTKFRSDRKATAFREVVAAFGEMEDLPEDSFKESGTGVRTVVVSLRRPA